MENESALLTLTDDEGNEIEFELLDVIEYEDEEYIILKPKAARFETMEAEET